MADGNAVAVMQPRSVRPLEASVTFEPNTGCWLWLGSVNHHGYGHVCRNSVSGGKVTLAHRAMWETVSGAIPHGMSVLHKCDVRLCVNPDHLFLGDNAANVADKVRKGRQSRIFGERVVGSKLTEADVRSIRSDARSNCAVARDYGVSDVLVSYIRKRKSWRHVS